MTKLREPLTYQYTLTKVAALIGWDRCAAICGVRSDRTVRLWSDPDCETEIRMIDAERLDRAYLDHGGDHAPFHRLHGLRIDMASRDAPDLCLSVLAAAAAKETGEAIAALISASACSDTRTVRRTRKELEEAIEALTSGLVALDRREKGEQP
ncbi:MAG: hypothetical protein VX205_00215 [Pseudomonadota bacterium]|nr:hypothetical protein [Pseudomonadota bacterium]MEC8033400.1 hypothetical protein [Pseudomonadota bacterium]